MKKASETGSAETEEALSAQEPFQNSYEQDYKKDTFNNDEQKESFVQPMAEVSSQETPLSSYQSERSGYLDGKSAEVVDDTPFRLAEIRLLIIQRIRKKITKRITAVIDGIIIWTCLAWTIPKN